MAVPDSYVYEERRGGFQVARRFFENWPPRPLANAVCCPHLSAGAAPASACSTNGQRPRAWPPGGRATSLPPMSKQQPSGVLGQLPQSRPHRRSDKRAAKPAVAATVAPAPESETKAPTNTPKASPNTPKPAATKSRAATRKQAPAAKRAAPAQKATAPATTSRVAAQKAAQQAAQPIPPPNTRPDVVSTAVQAAAEL